MEGGIMDDLESIKKVIEEAVENALISIRADINHLQYEMEDAKEDVEEAIVSHEEGTAVVSMTNEVSDDVLTQTVEDKDYKVTKIE